MKKKLVSVILAATMAMGMLIGCGGGERTDAGASSGQQQAASDGQQDQSAPGEEGGRAGSDGAVETIRVYSMNPGTVGDSSAVMGRVNEITRDKIGVEVEWTFLDMGQYFQQYFMLTSGGEEMDLIASYYDLAQAAYNQGAFMDLHELLDTYGTDYKALLSEEDWKAAEVNGNLWGLPTKHGVGRRIGFEYDMDLAEELNLDVSSVKTVADWTAILAQVHEQRPELMGIVSAMGGGTIGSFFKNTNSWDNLVDNLGVILYDEESKVVNLYETDIYRELCETAHEWNQKGYVQADAATTTELFENLVKSGKAFSTFTNCALGDEEALSRKTGKRIGFVSIGEYRKLTTGLVTAQWNIPASAKHGEAAMKFLNLLATDDELQTLLSFGLEGEDYQVLADGKLDYPEGKDISSVNFHTGLGFILPNSYLLPTWNGELENVQERAEEIDKASLASPAYGFTYDSAAVTNEITSCSNIVQQYANALECGSVDPAVILPEFIQALKDAGIDAIVADKQAQYDAFRGQ